MRNWMGAVLLNQTLSLGTPNIIAFTTKVILIKSCIGLFYKELEIKPCGLGSKIRDMVAEWRLRIITHKFLGESLVSRTGAEE